MNWDVVRDLASAIAALGTAGAFVAAVLLYRREKNRDEERESERRRSQAEKVAAWYGRKCYAVVGDSDRSSWRVFVHNESDLPVFMAQPRAYRRVDVSRRDPLVVCPPGTAKALIHASGVRGGHPFVQPVVAPRSTVELQVVASTADEVDPVVDLTFRDNAGRSWEIRSGDLRLVVGPS